MRLSDARRRGEARRSTAPRTGERAGPCASSGRDGEAVARCRAPASTSAVAVGRRRQQRSSARPSRTRDRRGVRGGAGERSARTSETREPVRLPVEPERGGTGRSCRPRDRGGDVEHAVAELARSSVPARRPSARGSRRPRRRAATGSPPRRARRRPRPAVPRTRCRCRSRRGPASGAGQRRCGDSGRRSRRARDGALKTSSPGAASERWEPVLENDARAPVAVGGRRPRGRRRRRLASRRAAGARPGTRPGCRS